MLYKATLCSFFQQGKCLRGSHCSFAHCNDELRDRPNLRKTRLCESFSRGRCAKGERCAFAHGRAELRSWNKKSTMCKRFKEGRCKRAERCPYAHSILELERNTSSSSSAASLLPSSPRECGGVDGDDEDDDLVCWAESGGGAAEPDDIFMVMAEQRKREQQQLGRGESSPPIITTSPIEGTILAPSVLCSGLEGNRGGVVKGRGGRLGAVMDGTVEAAGWRCHQQHLQCRLPSPAVDKVAMSPRSAMLSAACSLLCQSDGGALPDAEISSTLAAMTTAGSASFGGSPGTSTSSVADTSCRSEAHEDVGLDGWMSFASSPTGQLQRCYAGGKLQFSEELLAREHCLLSDRSSRVSSPSSPVSAQSFANGGFGDCGGGGGCTDGGVVAGAHSRHRVLGRGGCIAGPPSPSLTAGFTDSSSNNSEESNDHIELLPALREGLWEVLAATPTTPAAPTPAAGQAQNETCIGHRSAAAAAAAALLTETGQGARKVATTGCDEEVFAAAAAAAVIGGGSSTEGVGGGITTMAAGTSSSSSPPNLVDFGFSAHNSSSSPSLPSRVISSSRQGEEGSDVVVGRPGGLTTAPIAIPSSALWPHPPSSPPPMTNSELTAAFLAALGQLGCGSESANYYCRLLLQEDPEGGGEGGKGASRGGGSGSSTDGGGGGVATLVDQLPVAGGAATTASPERKEEQQQEQKPQKLLNVIKLSDEPLAVGEAQRSKAAAAGGGRLPSTTTASAGGGAFSRAAVIGGAGWDGENNRRERHGGGTVSPFGLAGQTTMTTSPTRKVLSDKTALVGTNSTAMAIPPSEEDTQFDVSSVIEGMRAAFLRCQGDACVGGGGPVAAGASKEIGSTCGVVEEGATAATAGVAVRRGGPFSSSVLFQGLDSPQRVADSSSSSSGLGGGSGVATLLQPQKQQQLQQTMDKGPLVVSPGTATGEINCIKDEVVAAGRFPDALLPLLMARGGVRGGQGVDTSSVYGGVAAAVAGDGVATAGARGDEATTASVGGCGVGDVGAGGGSGGALGSVGDQQVDPSVVMASLSRMARVCGQDIANLLSPSLEDSASAARSVESLLQDLGVLRIA